MELDQNAQNNTKVVGNTDVEEKPVSNETLSMNNVPELPKENDVVIGAGKEKGGKGILLGLILCAVLAAGGIGFGVWAMIDGNTRADNLNLQINTLKTQNSELMEQLGQASVDDGDTIINIDTDSEYTNPVIKSDNAEVSYSLGFQSSYILGQSSTKRANINIVDGKISSCSLMERVDDASWRNVGECSISGLDGDIYKVVEIGQGQDNGNNMIGFIMKNGKVAYFKLYDLDLSNSVNINGYLNINKYVIDAFEISVGSGVAGGYSSTVFVMSDSSYVVFDSNMLN